MWMTEIDSSQITSEKRTPVFKKLKALMLSNTIEGYRLHYKNLDSYSLVYVWVDEDGKPLKVGTNTEDVKSYSVFSSEHLAIRVQRPFTFAELKEESIDGARIKEVTLKMMMLGELVDVLAKSESRPQVIKINPVLVEEKKGVEPLYFAEEVLFTPVFDNFTKKYLLTDPNEAKALLALSPNDQERFGIELCFYMLSSRTWPEERESREEILQNKLEEMVFVLPRVPMKRGSGTFLVIILNLENQWEEMAFIRDHKTFDQYGDIVFVTSSLKMMTGKLEEIAYDGTSIDTIFLPLIRWQAGHRKNL